MWKVVLGSTVTACERETGWRKGNESVQLSGFLLLVLELGLLKTLWETIQSTPH